MLFLLDSGLGVLLRVLVLGAVVLGTFTELPLRLLKNDGLGDLADFAAMLLY